MRKVISTLRISNNGCYFTDASRATWINPATGKRHGAGEYPATGTQVFSTPKGWDDGLVLVEGQK